ncbi:SulP family sulfate transporter [Sinorhizobium fredii USDA 205]|uniref:STAS domain-containing protein n=2 Tax=Rhizobium fredii TaxID=380 RepID=A0A2A6M3X9_RHIFR|nr:SulP family inorganic anion transporter [Sinorhizobium fredii]ASY69069.1 Sulfate permease [Sinorhizobium fredii CCBAU 83666]AWM25204.1 Sulfate permease [Sinorhizobium fredii CCBAU 25509]KSV89878.1 SulP family sulfate transporter [Sinorhizobium fredii USDA 205]MCG5475464.1 SulP family inorganic anion transporter [Sinorhizobium fredii]MQW95128.1 STAS domain-containing protein [Sinorhizobium fredii]
MPDSLVPKTVSVLAEGYGLARLKADALAGLTVAIVALPLSMAIAIASGVTPDRGLYTAIVGGFLVSLLGGSRVQIGGPAGAFIVLLAATAARHGIDGLLLATAMAGVMLVAAGYLRLGQYIKFIPYPVTVGFTAGIAVIIFASQLRDLFGLTLPGSEPGPIVEKIMALGQSAGTASWAAVLTAALTITIILALRRLRPHWPGMLIAVTGASVIVAILHLPTETIGTRFGGIPRGLPLPALPPLSFEKAVAVFPDAVSFALLGAIESLLSAVVADGMTGRRHRSSMELIGQGIANLCSALFGGICVTGTIARTATNVRAGGTSPISGMLHSAFLLLFMLLAAPLASYIPLASLAGVLAVVAWNMIEKPAFMALLRSSYGDAVVLLATFFIVVFRDLTEGIVVGVALGAVLFINRMAKSISVGETKPLAMLQSTNGEEHPVISDDPDTVIYRISGIFFFGSAATVATVLDRIADQRRNFILDCSEVPFMDSTAANVIEGTLRKAERIGVRFIIVGANTQVRRALYQHHVRPPRVLMRASVQAALETIRSEKSA